ncbi:MAG: response regulator, partial [Thiotrichaceae bacterium]|nr:response regulator [Thiotrichaceae bacterium]
MNTDIINKDCSDSLYEQINSSKKETLSPTILIVDDEKLLRESVRDLLSIYDFNCILAQDGQQAFDLLKKQSVDIILLDLVMPNVDGFEVMQAVHVQCPDVDIVVTSGEATFDNATLAMRHGVKDFLHKPYNPADLIKVVNNLLEKRQLRRELEEMQHCIRVSEQRYSFFTNNSPDMIYMLDKDGNFAFVNDRASELLGYSQEEFIGQHYTNFIHEDDIEKAKCAFGSTAENIDVKQSIEFRMLAKHPEMEP